MDKSKYIRSYKLLHRYLAGVVVFCFLVTIAGSVVQGASLAEIVLRSIKVVLTLGAVCWLVLRLWRIVDRIYLESSTFEID